MDSTRPANALRKRVSRRAMLAALKGFAATSLLGRLSNAQSHESPPIFQTTRYQFTLIRPATEFRPVVLNDLKGRATSLASVPGKVLLINLWATWCDACRMDLPMLERFHLAMGDRIAVVAVSMDKTDRERVRSYLEKLLIRRLPILLDPDGRVASSSTESPAQFTAYGMPITYLIDASGQIAGYISGAADWLADDAQRLLAYYSST